MRHCVAPHLLLLPLGPRMGGISRGVPPPAMGLFDSLAAAFANEDMGGDRGAARAGISADELAGSSWRCELSVVGISTAPDPSADLYGQRTSVVVAKNFQKRVEATVELRLLAGGVASVAASQLTSAADGRWWLDGDELQLECTTPGIKLTSSWRTDTGSLDSLGSSAMVVPPGALYLRGAIERFGTRASVPSGAVQVRVEKGKFNTYFSEAGRWEAVGELPVR